MSAMICCIRDALLALQAINLVTRGAMAFSYAATTLLNFFPPQLPLDSLTEFKTALLTLHLTSLPTLTSSTSPTLHLNINFLCYSPLLFVLFNLLISSYWYFVNYTINNKVPVSSILTDFIWCKVTLTAMKYMSN